VQKRSFSIYRNIENNPGSGGYVVSKDFAKILLEYSDPFYHLVDSFMFSPRRVISAQFHSYQLTPALCLQGRKNKEFCARHPIHPTLIGQDYRLANQSKRQKKNLKFYFERMKIYWRFYKAL